MNCCRTAFYSLKFNPDKSAVTVRVRLNERVLCSGNRRVVYFLIFHIFCRNIGRFFARIAKIKSRNFEIVTAISHNMERGNFFNWCCVIKIYRNIYLKFVAYFNIAVAVTLDFSRNFGVSAVRIIGKNRAERRQNQNQSENYRQNFFHNILPVDVYFKTSV